ncbi:MAG: FliH/SctL family protein [Methylotenera sp.]
MGVLIKAKLTDDLHSDYLLPLQSFNKEPEVEDLHQDSGISDSSNTHELTEELNVIDDEQSYLNNNEIEKAQTLTQLELDEIKQNAREEAYREGYEQSISDVMAKYSEQLEAFDSVLNSLNNAIPEYIQKSESVIAGIVYESVCKIIGKALINQSKSLEVVKQTISELDIQKIREVYINQSDYDAIEDLKKSFPSDKEPINLLEFTVDPTIHYGGCKVKLVDGYLNASIDKQLAILSTILTKKVEELSGR